jgi:HEPN domain-containing protein
VELALKALLRSHGIDPPRVHDVSDVLLAERSRAFSRSGSRPSRRRARRWWSTR